MPPPAPSAPGGDKPAPDKEEDDTDGVFGPFRIGILVGGGLPNLISFGGAIKLTRYLGGGVNIGLIPAVKIALYGEAELSYQQYDIYGRLFPMGGAFFLGAGAGYATVKGTFKNSYDVSSFQTFAPTLPDRLEVTSEGSVRTLVLTPVIGLQHTFGPGFTIGIDAGAQIPIAPSEVKFATKVPPSVPAPVVDQFVTQFVTPNDKKVEETLDSIGRTILPTFNVRLGWLL